MKVLVTGACGFLGSTVVRYLIDAGYSVRAMVRKKSEISMLSGLDIEITGGDILHPQAVERAVSGCKIILHLASAYTFYPWWEKEAKGIYKINVDGTKNLLAAALRHKVEKFIFTSSIASIGRRLDDRPSNEETLFDLWHMASHYGRSKVLAEYEVLKACAKGLPAVILNPAIIIGQRDYKPTPSGEIILKFLNRRYPFYFKAEWAIADVDDVAKAHIETIKKGKSGQRYILCNKGSYSVKDIFKLLEKISGVRAPLIKVPYPILLFFAYIDEWLSYFIFKKKPLISTEGLRFCRMSIRFDNSKAVKELGYTTTPIIQTLTKAVNWYKENGYVKNA